MPAESFLQCKEMMPALFGLLGVVVGVLLTHISQHWISKFKTRTEYKQKFLFEPVFSFVKRDMEYIQKTYSRTITPKNKDVYFNDEYIYELLMVEALVESLGNKELIDKFHNYSLLRIEMGNAVNSGDFDKPKEKLEEAKKSAAEVIKLLSQVLVKK